MKHKKVYQDNQSTILMENNGRASNLRLTKHIKAWYSFKKDHIDQGDVEFEY